MFLRLSLLLLGLASSYIGSLSFQNGTGFDFAIGGGALLIGILCFFFLAKGLWRFLGCLSTFVLMAVIVAVLFFFVSGSDMIKDMTAKILGKTTQETAEQAMQASAGSPAETAPVAPDQMQQPAAPAQPQQPPVVTGNIESIVSGDVFRMGGHTFRLYGIAAPMIDQTCADQSGRSYECGYISARMLKDFVGGDQVRCRVMNVNAQREIMAACSVGTFDIGAALVEAGWALALPNITPIYVPYQAKARQEHKGLWMGQFLMPWEWAVQQKQIEETKAKIKVPNIPSPKKKKKSIFDSF